MGADPVDGEGEAVFEGGGRSPAQVYAGFAIVGEEALDFGLFGADAFRIADDGELVLVEEVQDGFGNLGDGDFGAGAKVEGLANDICAGFGVEEGFCGIDESVDGVIHEGEIAAGIQAAKVDAIPGECLGDDGGDDGAGGLPGPVGVEGADGDGLDVEGAVPGFDQFVGADFAGGVGGLSLEGVVFVDGDVLGGAVDFGGGGVDEGDAVFAAGLEDVEGAGDVGVDDFEGVLVGIRDGDQRA